VRPMPPRHLADLDLAGRRAAVAELGEKEFRAGQMSAHYFGRLGARPGGDDRPAGIRSGPAHGGHAAAIAHAGTRVHLRRWRDPARHCGGCTTAPLVESVLMGYPDRVTVVRSPARPAVAWPAPFCATGQAGLTRNLSHRRDCRPGGLVRRGSRPAERSRARRRDCSHVVFHGYGASPLANYPRLMGRAAPAHRAVARRARTVPSATSRFSTVGLVPGDASADRRKALSVTPGVCRLHAPDDELRDELVPVNQRWPVAEVLDAAWGVRGTNRVAGSRSSTR